MYNLSLLSQNLQEWGMWVLTKLRRQRFVRQLLTKRSSFPTGDRRTTWRRTNLFAVKLLLFARCVCVKVSVGRREKKVTYIVESSEEETKQNVYRSKNSHTFKCIASACDSGQEPVAVMNVRVPCKARQVVWNCSLCGKHFALIVNFVVKVQLNGWYN
jgi:hypothetical protein